MRRTHAIHGDFTVNSSSSIAPDTRPASRSFATLTCRPDGPPIWSTVLSRVMCRVFLNESNWLTRSLAPPRSWVRSTHTVSPSPSDLHPKVTSATHPLTEQGLRLDLVEGHVLVQQAGGQFQIAEGDPCESSDDRTIAPTEDHGDELVREICQSIFVLG